MKQLLVLISLLVVALEANAQNWVRTAGPVEDDVHDLCIDSNGILYAVTPFGVNRSTNGGEHWTRPFMFPAVSDFNHITVAPNGNIIASSFDGIFLSVDSGNTFLNTFSDPSSFNFPDVIFQFATTGSGRIIATHFQGPVYSDNNGHSWNKIDVTGQQWSVEVPFGVAASNDTVILHTDVQPYVSFDNGRSWNVLSRVSEPQVFRMLILPKSVWVAHDSYEGLLRYTPAQGWVPFTGAPPTQIYTADRMYDGSMLVASASGIYHVQDTSKWVDITVGLTRNDSNYYHPVTRFVEDPATGAYYAATFGAGVWKRTSPVTGSRRANAVAAPVQVSPNPFTNTATVHFTEPHPSWSEIELRNILGAVVWKNDREYTTAGMNTLPIEVSGIPVGNYLLVLRTNERTETQWVTILK